MDGKTIDTNASRDGTDESGESWGSFLVFVLKLALIVLIFRSFVFSPFSIPSQSMQPRLWTGDYLLAAKWPYGISKYSLPFEAPLISGRIFASQPERGDVVIFWRGSPASWMGHVALYHGPAANSNDILVLGGNQNDELNISAYSTARVLGVRRATR